MSNPGSRSSIGAGGGPIELGPDPSPVLTREVVFGQDGDFSWELFRKSYNAALANNLGNLVNRLTTMAHRYRNGRLSGTDARARTEAVVDACVPGYREAMNRLHLSGATVFAFSVVDAANEIIAKGEP